MNYGEDMNPLRRSSPLPDRASLTEPTRRVVYLALGWAIAFFSSGCGRSDTSGSVAIPRARGTVTFCRDVAPIIFKHCSPCHRPSQSGPFDLLSYADVLEEEDTQRTPELQHAVATHIHDLCALAIGTTREAAEIAEGRGLRACARSRLISFETCGTETSP